MSVSRNTFFYIALALVPALPMSSCSEPVDGLIHEEKVISSDERWEHDMMVKGNVKVQNGATLTIAAGVRVTLATGTRILVGNDGVATIKIEGTASRPVRISGGDGLQIIRSSASSSISHCFIADAGGSDGNALSINKLNFPIDNLTIRGGGGVEIKGLLFGGKISGLTIDCDNPIALSVPADYRQYIEGLSVGSKMVHLRNGGNSPSLELDSEVTYAVTNEVELQGDVTISDVNIYFAPNASLSVGNKFIPTKVTFVHSNFMASPEGQWNGILFGGSVTAKSRMVDCKVSGAKVGIMLMSESTFTVSGCDFSNNAVPVRLVRGSVWDPGTIAGNNVIPGGVGGISLTSKGARMNPDERVAR